MKTTLEYYLFAFHVDYLNLAQALQLSTALSLSATVWVVLNVCKIKLRLYAASVQSIDMGHRKLGQNKD